MIQRLVLHPIELSNRELPWRLAQAADLATLGIKSLVGEQTLINHFALKSSIHSIYLGKSLIQIANPDFTIDYANQILSNVTALLWLQEEGGLFLQGDNSISDVEMYSNVNPLSSLTYLDKITFCHWGDYQDNINAQSVRSVVTGHPRFDLTKPSHPFHSFLTPGDFSKSISADLNGISLEDSSETPKIRILLVSSGGLFFSKHSTASITSQLSIFSSSLISDALRSTSQQLLTYDIYIDIIRHFCNQPGYEIILRPHPCESIEDVARIFSSYPNLIIQDSRLGFSLNHTILNSDLIIHDGCTSAVESLNYDKKKFILIHYEEKAPCKSIGFRVSSSTEAISAINHFTFNKKLASSSKLDVVSSLVSNLDTSTSSIKNISRLCDSIFSFSESDLSPISIPYRRLCSLFLMHIKYSLRYKLRSQIPKFQPLTPNYITYCRKFLSASYPTVSLKFMNPHCVLIEPVQSSQ